MNEKKSFFLSSFFIFDILGIRDIPSLPATALI